MGDLKMQLCAVGPVSNPFGSFVSSTTAVSFPLTEGESRAHAQDESAKEKENREPCP
jgi:hypothetical protein